MPTYTGLCQSVDGTGTIWIEAVESPDLATAIIDAQEACADAWDCDMKSVHVLGIAAGDVTILHWEDLAC